MFVSSHNFAFHCVFRNDITMASSSPRAMEDTGICDVLNISQLPEFSQSFDSKDLPTDGPPMGQPNESSYYTSKESPVNRDNDSAPPDTFFPSSMPPFTQVNALA